MQFEMNVAGGRPTTSEVKHIISYEQPEFRVRTRGEVK
jgi:hypothetical protein